MSRNIIVIALAGILWASLAGCGTIPSYEDIGNGYVEATYIRTSWEPTAMRIELRYKTGWGMVKIWPSLDGIRPVLKNDKVVFVAMKASEPPLLDEPRATMPRLFAVKAPGLPMDITDEVLRRWSVESGNDFQKTDPATIVTPHEKDDAVEFTFTTEISGSRQGEMLRLNWIQISDIMREVEEKGVVCKDRVWGTSYIELKFIRSS